MSDLASLVCQRKFIRQAITKLDNSKANFTNLNRIEKLTKKQTVNDYREKLQNLNSKIQSLKFSDPLNLGTEYEEELTRCDEYELKITSCLVTLDDLIKRDLVSIDTGIVTPQVNSYLKRPSAPLPEFRSGENEDITRFFYNFEEVISRYPYSEYDKFLLLKQQITGRVSALIDSLEVDKQTYNSAKALILKAIASPEKQKFNTIKQISQMKMSAKTDPFEYISKLKNVKENVKKLNIQVDDVLQYFFLDGMEEEFKSQLVNLTQKTMPTVDEMEPHLFEASERYINIKSKSVKKVEERKPNKEVISFATNVNHESPKITNLKPCVLCTEATHAIYNCPTFETPKDKIDKINHLNGCIRCGLLNHKSGSCRFRFVTRCQSCYKWHMTYLCNEKGVNKTKESRDIKESKLSKPKNSVDTPNKQKKENPIKSKNKSEVASNICHVEALNCNNDSSSILPTFSGFINQTKIRVLKDGGCQANLISEKIAKKLKLRVVEKGVVLTLKGINSHKRYKTNIVEVELTLGNKVEKILAFCIPSIDISLNLDKLNSIVHEFKKKSYKLADDYLLNDICEIKDLDLILGTKSGFCVPETEIIFGPNNRQMFSKTPIGVILKGDENELFDNLCYLPENDSKNVITSLVCMDQDEVGRQIDLFDCHDKLLEDRLKNAVKDILNEQCAFYTNLDKEIYSDDSELNKKLIKFVLNNTTRNEEGRLVMPLIWNSHCSHLLGQNKRLSEIILKSLKNKMGKNPQKLELIDQVFKEQVKMGIIEKIPNLEEYMRNFPNCSFLPFMGVFKDERETTKCRVVFLSNLCESNPKLPLTVSHNQSIHAGPCLNQKLSTSLMKLRFNEKICCFDLKKAFNNIMLNEMDQSKLLFLWFRNIDKGDFTPVAYKNVRLPFGLRCSPTVLLLGLYKILIIDAENDEYKLKNLKRQIYDLCYMDNCCFSASNSDELIEMYEQLPGIFSPYGFDIQQCITNDVKLQNLINENEQIENDSDSKLLGLKWDKVWDNLRTKPFNLDRNAETKRSILSSIASQYDLFNYNGPIMNRAKLFLHKLQLDQDLGWDAKISDNLIKEWKNISIQVNNSPVLSIPRYVGSNKDEYSLIAFSDSSTNLIGTVIYIKNNNTKNINFVMSKNQIINKQLAVKSMPVKELQGILFACNTVIDLHKELSSDDNIDRIKITNIEIFSDSLVALTWINSVVNKFDKDKKKVNIFVKNRIEQIINNCQKFPITFSFVSGEENPADYSTRCTSYKQLVKTNYLVGPTFLKNPHNFQSNPEVMKFTVPNPLSVKESLEYNDLGTNNAIASSNVCLPVTDAHDILLKDRFSSFRRLVKVYKIVFTFISKLKAKIKKPVQDYENPYIKAYEYIFKLEQKEHYPDVVKFFRSKKKRIRDIPNIVNQLNVFMDVNGVLRIKSKFEKMVGKSYDCPILLPKDSVVTNLIIRELHEKFNHAGIYTILKELRTRFWVPHCFSKVKKIIKQCVNCKRFNNRPLNVNQSPYRIERVNPIEIPFAQIYIDYLGPFHVSCNKQKSKVYILCITCMWSRAVNLKICLDLSTNEFLRGFQMHIFEHGIPQKCFSDLGSQLVAGGNIIKDNLKDPETQNYFLENNVVPISFEHYFKGRSELGSLVESIVKMTKKLIYGSIKKRVHSLREFEFLISSVIHILNRRPVAFKESLRDSNSTDLPQPITPELLMKGHNLLSINVIPELNTEYTDEWVPVGTKTILERFGKLQKSREELFKIYENEFIQTLVHQAIDKQDRYKPVFHHNIKVGDIVLLKELHKKPIDFPMARIIEIVKNSNNEVTGVVAKRGQTGEIVKRHSTTIIPLLQVDNAIDVDNTIDATNPSASGEVYKTRSKRKAAERSEKLTQTMLQEDCGF